MKPDVAAKLEILRSDYKDAAGKVFENFFCPIIFKDEPVKLCKAHLINQAFRGSSTRWTIQRADVDNFYGHAFEGDFVDLRHQGSSVESFYNDPSSVKHLGPRMYLNGKEIGYYLPDKHIPPHHSEIQIQGATRTVRLALKVHPTEMLVGERPFVEVGIEKDLRMSALVSVLKAAHLTVFETLGYRYALSAGGMLLGYTVLGRFFLQNQDLDKKKVLVNAEAHFPEYANLVRPVLNPSAVLLDTVNDRAMYICEGLNRWAFLVFVKTTDFVHAAIVPLLETPDAAAYFVKFLKSNGGVIHTRQCHYDGEMFRIAPNTQEMVWPESNFR